MPENKDPYFSKTLDKGLKVLALFNEEHPSRTQTEVAKTLGLNMTSAYRFIHTLVQLGYLQRDEDSKRIRLGVRAMILSATVLRTINAHGAVRSLVDQVHEAHGLTVDVALVMDQAMTIVHRREAEATLTHRLPSVSRAWHTTSLGKAYLAFIPEDELAQALAQLDLAAKTPKTITEPAALRAEIQAVRRRGYATADEEFLPGLITIGAPIIHLDAGWAVGSVSFDFSTLQMDAATMKDRYADLVMDLAAGISKMITAF
jgi:DNA-binding IclR family transcriptional regulator